MIEPRSILRGAGALVGGAVASQLITVATLPLVTRLFAPDVYGQFSIALSVVAMLAPLSTLTFFLAVVLPERHSTARRIVVLSVAVAGVVSLVLLLVCAAFSRAAGAGLGLGDAGWLLWFVPPLLLLNGVCDPLTQWLYRVERFGAVARNAVHAILVQRGLQVGLGLVGPSAAGLLAAQVAAQLWRAAHLFALCRPTLSAARPDGERIAFAALARAYADFPLYRLPQALLFAISTNVPVFALGYLFGAAEAALFAMARALMQLPVSVVSQALGTVLLPRVLEGIRSGADVRRTLGRVLMWLGAAGIVPFAVVGVLAVELFALVFGSDWSGAGRYAQLLSVMMFLQFLQIPLTRTIPALGLQRFLLLVESGTAALRVGAIALGGVVLDSPMAAIGAYAVVSALSSALLIRTVLVRSATIEASGLDRLRL